MGNIYLKYHLKYAIMQSMSLGEIERARIQSKISFEVCYHAEGRG